MTTHLPSFRHHGADKYGAKGTPRHAAERAAPPSPSGLSASMHGGASYSPDPERPGPPAADQDDDALSRSLHGGRLFSPSPSGTGEARPLRRRHTVAASEPSLAVPVGAPSPLDWPSDSAPPLSRGSSSASGAGGSPGRALGRNRWSSPDLRRMAEIASASAASASVVVGGGSGAAAGSPARARAPVGSEASGSALPYDVVKIGMLTKLSKGGFTANWNRRAFALIGSSLFYAKDLEALPVSPKVFSEVFAAEITHSAGAPTGPNHVLALRLGEEGAAEAETLLFAADSARDKFEWIDALARGAHMMRCPLAKVAPMLALQMYGGCQDTTLGAVLQAPADTTRGTLVRLNNHNKPGVPYAADASEAATPGGRAFGVLAAPGVLARAPGSEAAGRPGTSGAQWMVDQWIPDLFWNV